MRLPWKRLAVHVSHSSPDCLTGRGDAAGARRVDPLLPIPAPSRMPRFGGHLPGDVWLMLLWPAPIGGC